MVGLPRSRAVPKWEMLSALLGACRGIEWSVAVINQLSATTRPRPTRCRLPEYVLGEIDPSACRLGAISRMRVSSGFKYRQALFLAFGPHFSLAMLELPRCGGESASLVALPMLFSHAPTVILAPGTDFPHFFLSTPGVFAVLEQSWIVVSLTARCDNFAVPE